MFLDEKLEEIYNSTELGSIDQSNKLIRTLVDSLNENFNKEMEVEDFLKELRRVDNSWQLFAKRHSEMDVMAFRKLIKELDKDGHFTKALNW